MVEGGGEKAGERRESDAPAEESRRIVYCVLPPELSRLHDSLRRHFRDRPDVEVIIERRGRERRTGSDRRARGAEGGPRAKERRIVRNVAGRRVADRRTSLVSLPADQVPQLPRSARRHADKVAFYERVEPATQEIEDADSGRLVVRFQAGDRDAFQQLYLRYFDRIYGYLRVLLDDQHETEDVTQQTFTKALENLPAYERRSQPFRAWLFVIARNAAISVLRKRGRTDVVEPSVLAARREDGATDASDDLPALGWVSDRDLLVLIDRLPLAQRQVLVLRHVMDMRAAQVAKVLGKNENEVRMLQHRAHKFLRQRLISLGRGPARGGERIRWHGRKRQAIVLRERRFALRP